MQTSILPSNSRPFEGNQFSFQVPALQGCLSLDDYSYFNALPLCPGSIFMNGTDMFQLVSFSPVVAKNLAIIEALVSQDENKVARNRADRHECDLINKTRGCAEAQAAQVKLSVTSSSLDLHKLLTFMWEFRRNVSKAEPWQDFTCVKLSLIMIVSVFYHPVSLLERFARVRQKWSLPESSLFIHECR